MQQARLHITDEVTNSMAAIASKAGGQAARTGRMTEIQLFCLMQGRFVIEKERGSIGMLQRQFKIGFNRAGRIMDQLADAGVVGPEIGTKPRKVLMTAEEFEEFIKNI
ncbi:MAG: DNA translocase FtsK [Lachnospira pectinoschiza]